MPDKKKVTKQAVVVIHGMGEQIPMDTLQGFVEATWESDTSLIDRTRGNGNTGEERGDRNPVWTKPDKRNRSYELRRITTETDDKNRRTDFYEYYWAHLMHGTTWDHLKSWVFDVMLRRRRNVPPDVRPAWYAIWTSLIVVFLLSLPIVHNWILSWEPLSIAMGWISHNISWLLTLLAAAAVAAIAKLKTFMRSYFGDVARYVKANPVNVARRQEIREKGIELLETLMGVDVDPIEIDDPDNPGKKILRWNSQYERIIVVGHSLGSMVAYDMLKHSFARINRRFLGDETQIQDQPARLEMEEYLREALADQGGSDGSKFDIDDYRRYQRACLTELREAGSPWTVSDFVTLGSPLTHAEFLMADDEKAVRKLQDKRILPTCPPVLEWDSDTGDDYFTYRPSDDNPEIYNLKINNADHFRYPHHAAHFAYTRWTNLHSKSHRIAWGDVISGKLGHLFGLCKNGVTLSGIKDVPVLPHRNQQEEPEGRIPFFTHTKYWSMKERTARDLTADTPHHIEKLRDALDLLDSRDR